MSKKTYAADGGVMRRIRKFYAADGGETRKLRKLYAADGGILRLIFISSYRWAVYNSVGTTLWNRSGAVEATTYVWKRYGVKKTYGEWRLWYIDSVDYALDSYSEAARWKYFSALKIDKSNYSETTGMVSVDRESFLCNGARDNFGSQSEIYNNILGKDTDGNEVRGVVLGAYGDSLTDAENKFDFTIPEGWTYIEVTSDIQYNAEDGKYHVAARRYEKTATRTETEEPDTESGNDEVTADSRGQYPTNGKSGSYWYIYDRQENGYKPGEMIDTVTSTNANAYPANGRHTDGYWYKRVGITYSRGDKLIGTAEDENENTYPENGRNMDGLWYVRED